MIGMPAAARLLWLRPKAAVRRSPVYCLHEAPIHLSRIRPGKVPQTLRCYLRCANGWRYP